MLHEPDSNQSHSTAEKEKIETQHKERKSASTSESNIQEILDKSSGDIEQEPWIEVKTKKTQALSKKHRLAPLKGSNENESSLKAAKQSRSHELSWIFVSGLDPNTTEQDVKNFLEQFNINSKLHCFKMLTKTDKIKSSFKIGVPCMMKEQIMSPDIWPVGVLINHFQNLQRPHLSPRAKMQEKIVKP